MLLRDYVPEPSGAGTVITAVALAPESHRQVISHVIILETRKMWPILLPALLPPSPFVLLSPYTLFYPPLSTEQVQYSPHQDAEASTTRSPSTPAWGCSLLGDQPVRFSDILKEIPDNISFTLHFPPRKTLWLSIFRASVSSWKLTLDSWKEYNYRWGKSIHCTYRGKVPWGPKGRENLENGCFLVLLSHQIKDSELHSGALFSRMTRWSIGKAGKNMPAIYEASWNCWAGV